MFRARLFVEQMDALPSSALILSVAPSRPSPEDRRILRLLNAADLSLRAVFSVVGPPQQPSRASESDPTTAPMSPGPAASPVPVPIRTFFALRFLEACLFPAAHCNSRGWGGPRGRHVPVGTLFGHVSSRRGVPDRRVSFPGASTQISHPVSLFSFSASR